MINKYNLTTQLMFVSIDFDFKRKKVIYLLYNFIWIHNITFSFIMLLIQIVTLE